MRTIFENKIVKAILPCALVLLFSILLSKQDAVLTTLERSEGMDKEETLTVTALFGDVSKSRDLTVTVYARSETKEEKKARLSAYLEALPSRILGDNPSLDRVFLSLDLVKSEEEIWIEWTSERPDIIGADGTFYPEAVRETQVAFALTANASLDDITETRTIPITVVYPENESETRRYLSMRLSDWKSWIDGEATESSLRLLPETRDGIELTWKRKGTNYVLPALLALSFVYFARWEGKRERKKRAEADARREIERAYPGFIDELLLYLNAGLVLQSAVYRIAEAHKNDPNPFYEAVQRICEEAEEKNVPIRTGFRIFAREKQIPSLLRFSAVLDDGVLKGTDIAEKLEVEAMLLRSSVLRSAEERGRKAETKLAFPMALLLGALLLITLSPVLLEMGG